MLPIHLGVAIRNKTPQSFGEVVINVSINIPQHARITSTKASVGTFEWTAHQVYGDTVTGHGQWTIPHLAAYARARVSFVAELIDAEVNDQVTVRAHLASSHPVALSVDQTSIVTVVA